MANYDERIEAGWNFDNSYARLPKSFFSEIELNPVKAPKLIILNDKLAITLGLDIDALKSEKGVGVFCW